jgi:hypothetical protein
MEVSRTLSNSTKLIRFYEKILLDLKYILIFIFTFETNSLPIFKSY